MPNKIFSKDDYFKMLDQRLKPQETTQLPDLAAKIAKIARRNGGPKTKESF